MSLARPVVAGNWKMHNGPTETARFFERFLPLLPGEGVGTVAFFPPAISFAAARQALSAHPEIRLGVQNVHWEEKGAFTGETSSAMAAEAGAALVLVGHSERRHVFGESDAETARKVGAVLRAGMAPVLCVGEKDEEREAGEATAVVERQLAAGFAGLAAGDAGSVLVAYEPVWAIGTGKTAAPADAEEMHGRIRAWLGQRFGPEAAAKIPILYGGSVKPENAGELMRRDDVDGVLVGGASLDPDGFARICTALA